MLVVRNINKKFKLKDKELTAVCDLSFSAREGEILCFIGPNGAGKTTAVKMLCGLINPSKGVIMYNSVSIKNRKEYLSNISALLEGARNIFWRLTPRENIDFFAKMKGFYGSKLNKRIDNYLDILDLSKNKDVQCRFLSRGNQQKVAIACALVPETGVVIMDEPTLGLDVEMARRVMKIIHRERQNNRIIIITTHDMELICEIADRLAIFQNGEAIIIHKISELITKYGDKDNKLSTAYLNYIGRNVSEYSCININ